MHGLSPEEEIDYWRERARRAEAEVEGLRRVVPLDQLPDASRKALIASVEREVMADLDTEALRWIVKYMSNVMPHIHAQSERAAGIANRALAALHRLCGSKP